MGTGKFAERKLNEFCRKINEYLIVYVHFNRYVVVSDERYFG